MNILKFVNSARNVTYRQNMGGEEWIKYIGYNIAFILQLLSLPANQTSSPPPPTPNPIIVRV